VVDRLRRVVSSRLHIQPATWNLQPVTARLHWLLPDWEWRLDVDGEQVIVFLESPYGPVSLRMGFGEAQEDRSLGSCAHFCPHAYKSPGTTSEIPQGRPQGVMLPSPRTQGRPRGARLRGYRPHGSSEGARRYRYTLDFGREAHPEFMVQVARAGETLYGEGQAAPTWGWASPTYGIKIPALSISFSVATSLPICLASEWIFPPGDGFYGDQLGRGNPAVGV
jgi:hypothetical protein